MKVLLLSHGSYIFDGRLRELLKVSRMLGQTETIIKDLDCQSTISQHLINKSYFYFIYYSIFRVLRNRRNIDVVFVDNRKACVPGLVIHKLRTNIPIILDCREMYIPSKVDTLSRRLGNFFESRLIKRADVVIAANSHRSAIMKEYYSLQREPLVFENIRQLEYSESFDEYSLKRKYQEFLEKDTYKIISTSGHIISRTNDRLVKSMVELGEKFELFLVGGGSNKDKATIQEIIQKNKLKNVTLISKVEEDELKFLIQQCDLGIVNYHDLDLNNKYCASGKIFEFVFEGLPVVTTENEPLKLLVENHQIGISDNNYTQAILEVHNNHEYYVNNVLKFADSLSVYDNNLKLAKSILSMISK